MKKENKIDEVIFVHKLKHGLTAIKWSLKMILSGDFGEVSDEQKDIIKKNMQEDEKLILLADNFLSPEFRSSLTTKNRNFLNKELCDAEHIVNSALEPYETKISEKKIKLEIIKPKEKIETFLDKEKIKIVIQNILDNAVKYTPEGGKITISLNKKNKNLEIKVQDSGIGIPENEKGRLFNKFFRGTNAAKMNNDGSGLGLFIAKNIIDEHGGKIWFDSTEGQGSAFYFTLPIKKV